MSDEHRILLTQGDVTVEEVQAVPDCGNCTATAAGTYGVILDLRTAGRMLTVEGDLCRECAGELAERIKSSLPPDSAEPGR